jgi:hypothetical protein
LPDRDGGGSFDEGLRTAVVFLFHRTPGWLLNFKNIVDYGISLASLPIGTSREEHPRRTDARGLLLKRTKKTARVPRNTSPLVKRLQNALPILAGAR